MIAPTAGNDASFFRNIYLNKMRSVGKTEETNEMYFPKGCEIGAEAEAEAEAEAPTSKSVEEMLREFSILFKAHIEDKPKIPHQNILDLRLKLMAEELSEYYESVKKFDLIEIADALADLVYVTVGTAIAFGIPFDEVFKEVHRSNMSKANPDGTVRYRDDGKILKPEGFSPPNIKSILESCYDLVR